MKAAYRKIPLEMALFSLQNQKVKPVRSYLAAQFIYPGKAKTKDHPARRIANEIGISESSVYRHFYWLLSRNWMGRDEANGWYFFRGLDRIHRMENWTFGRAAMMYQKDLKTCKAFLAGAVLASLVKTGNGQRTEQTTSIRTTRSVPPAAHISLSLLAKTLKLSTSTAYRLRKLASVEKYIVNHQHLIEITNWAPADLHFFKKQDMEKIPLALFGYQGKELFSINRIRYKKNKLFLQMPNLVEPSVQLKSRRGLSRYSP